MAITYSDVFELTKSTPDVQTLNQGLITNLITRMTAMVESAIGRKIATETFTDVLFSHGVNCEIYGEELFFTGKYRDIYSISSITELGISLSAATSYTGVGGYYLDLKLGKLVRIGQVWSCQQLAIKASGSLGIGGSGGAEDLKEAIIEMVAAKSGLWKNNIQTENGTIQNTRVNISDYAKAVLASYGFTWRKDL